MNEFCPVAGSALGENELNLPFKANEIKPISKQVPLSNEFHFYSSVK